MPGGFFDPGGEVEAQRALVLAQQSSPTFETDQPNVEEVLQRYARSLSGKTGERFPAESLSSEQLRELAEEGLPKRGPQAEIEHALKKVAVRRVMEEAAKTKEKLGPLPYEFSSLRTPSAVPEARGGIQSWLRNVLTGGREGISLSDVGESVGGLQRELEGAKALGASEGALSKLLPWAGKAAKVAGPIGVGLTAYGLGTSTAHAAERQAAGEQGTGRTVGDILDSLIGPIPKDEQGDYDPLQNLRLILKQMGERQGPAMGAR